MNYEEFVTTVTDELRRLYAGEASVEIHHFPRNNCSEQDAVCVVPEGRNISPVIYLRPFYEAYCGGQRMVDILSDMVRLVGRGEEVSYPVEELEHWECARKMIGAKLISITGNEEFLQDVPHREFMDMALVYFLYLNTDRAPAGTSVIHWNVMESWGVTEEELYEESLRNLPDMLPPRIFHMEAMLEEMLSGNCVRARNLLDEEEPVSSEELCGLYVVTNEQRWLGAVALFYHGVLDRFMERMGWESVYIIPSSIHEMLLVTGEPVEESRLLEMVCDVNDTTVDEQDRLTYSVYHYSRGMGLMSRVAHDLSPVKRLYGLEVA